jgi:acylphosphatase
LTAEKRACFYRVRGRVQGVGFRYFVQQKASALALAGWVRNDDDGTVQVYAIGTANQLSELAGFLWQGPRWAEVRGVEEVEAPLEQVRGFHVRQ